MTLLVNYWKDRSAGESYAPSLAQEQIYINYYDGIMAQMRETGRFNKPEVISSLRPIALNRDFNSDFSDWKKQNIPDYLLNSIALRYFMFKYDNGVRVYSAETAFEDCKNGAASCSIENESHLQDSLDIVSESPAVIFRLPESAAAVISRNSEASETYFDYWPKWTYNNATGLVEMSLVAQGAGFSHSTNLFRSSLPGGPPKWMLEEEERKKYQQQ